MAYRFARDDTSVGHALRRIASEQIDWAIGTIDAGATGAGDPVHEVRKSCKKIRGLLRLVRPGFAPYADENAAFRDIARAVSALRDATVLTDSYDAIMAAYGDQVDRRALGVIRRRLTLMRKERTAQHDAAALLAQCRDRLVDAGERVRAWRLDDDGFTAIAGGLRKTYRRARKAMRETRKTPAPDHFHDWRKRCKYHWYHARLLQPIWPGPMKAHIACAHELGEVLGEHHDLMVFLDALAAQASKFDDAARIEVMAGLVRSRQAVLAARAFALGARLLAEPSSALASSWGVRYTAWRGQEQATVVVPGDDAVS
jgi:CHAD domain-containing protein